VSVRFLVGDVRAKLKELPDESVHCVVTSPPYYGLRDYGTAQWEGGDPACDHMQPADGIRNVGRDRAASGGKFHDNPNPAEIKQQYRSVCRKCGARRIDSQIGLEATPAAFVAELVAVFREVRRVLRSDGCVFLNLGDSFWTNGPCQTGRNDTNRETPGGRGGSFRGGVRRAIVCDTPGKAPEGFQERDCFCQNLCGACREAYRIGKSHSARPPASTRPVSSSVSTPAHTGSPLDHPPMSDSIRQEDHSANAIRGSEHSLVREPAPLHAFHLTTLDESSQPLPASSRLSDTPLGCLVCGRSLQSGAQASAGKSASPSEQRIASLSTPDQQTNSHGTTAIDGASPDRILGMACGCCAPINNTTPRHQSLKPKDLIGIPWTLAFALRDDGWFLRSEIIWAKPNPMPESVTDRPTKSHETVFLLTKSASYAYDAQAIAEPASSSDRQQPDPSAKTISPNETPWLNNRYAPGASGYGVGKDGMRNRRSVWTIATAPFSEAHFATFPPELPELCIRAGTSERGCCPHCGKGWARVVEREPDTRVAYATVGTGEKASGAGRNEGSTAKGIRKVLREDGRGGDLATAKVTHIGWSPSCSCPPHEPVPATVLDPFAGAGTTGLVADRLGRNAILIELNPAYADMARKRIESDAGMFACLEAAE
jgi:DNA modification methylase